MKLTDYQFFRHLCQLDFIDEIWLYGSWATGTARENSDIDLAIVCPRASEQDWQDALMIVFNADALRGIDCVRFDTLTDQNFKESIEKEKVVVFSRTKK